MTDTLAYRAIVAVMTPAMNTVVEPELAMLQPAGVCNQTQRFRLGGEQISEDLIDEALKLMDCKPAAFAIGLTTDAGIGGVDKLAARCEALAAATGVPVCNASRANHAALRALGASRIAVVTPFRPEVDRNVRANLEAAGFEVAAIRGTGAPSLEAIAATPVADIRGVFREVAREDVDAILQVGTALPVLALVQGLEAELGKPVVACNAAVYWQTLRRIGIDDPIEGFGLLLASH